MAVEHLVDQHGGYLCPEAEARDAMSDAEFWDHVLQPHDGPMDDWEPDDGDVDEWGLESRLADPCPECGQLGACAYDVEGRALIHVTEASDA